MGLFWSMNKESGADDAAAFYPLSPDLAEAYDVLLTATPERSEAVGVRVHRAWLTPGVTHRTLDLAADKVVGEIYEPSAQSRGGVLLLGGSEGGISVKYQAALLASHGFTALALGYFALPGLPQTLHDIPIEYFATAARLLPGTIRVIGYSRGTEAALLLSALYPDVVRGTVVLAPADRVWPAFPPPGDAWTYRGEPLTAIPFGRIAGPVLAIAGTDDQLWPAGTAAEAVARATGGESLLCAGAGHGVGGLPYLPAGTTFRHPVTGEVLHLGGTREANEKAHQQAWARVLQFLT
jgi:dienelactone hydrolase